MILIDSPLHDPALNLALEEVLFRNSREEYLLFYVNRPSVIVGKHQNVFREVNPGFIRETGMPVVRRLTGGGTVYHDEGNQNFSFILNGEAGKLVDFARYMEPVIRYLRSLGIAVEMDTRHNLRIRGLKISGNAEHVFRDRVLHHGTLLFQSDLDLLEKVLKPPPGEYYDKAVASVQSRVTNIVDHLPEKISKEDFRKGLIGFCEEYFEHSIRETDIRNWLPDTEKLADDKYRTIEWNYGYSPDFEFSNRGKLGGKTCKVIARIQKGRVKEIHLEPGDLSKFNYLCRMSEGVLFLRDEMEGQMNHIQETELPARLKEEWINLLFPQTENV